MACLDAESVGIECCLIHFPYTVHFDQQMLMNVKGTTTVRMAASTDLAPTSVHVLEGTCCIQMDGVVNVSHFHMRH